MKFLHLSDLHIGKRVNEYSMLEDQEYILKEILRISDDEAPDGIIIAGDVYDKSVPSAEAVQLLDEFLSALASRGLKTFIISGNHDSAERVSFGARLMALGGIHIAPVYDGEVKPIVMKDAHGSVNVYLLPFIKPIHVRRFTEEEVVSYTDAMAIAVDKMGIDTSERNILVTHQFVTGATRSDSEEISVGGTDNVDGAVFDGFDYVALGHIHRPQSCGDERIRYCGTPLKYSFSEAGDKKSVTVVELGAKGDLKIRTVPLVPLRDMVEIKGLYNDIMQKDFYEGTTYREDYVHVTLTDEEDVVNAMSKLRTVYHNLMKLDYDNTRTRSSKEIQAAEEIEKKSHLQLFEEFYEMQNGAPMSEEQRDFMISLIEKVWEGEK